MHARAHTHTQVAQHGLPQKVCQRVVALTSLPAAAVVVLIADNRVALHRRCANHSRFISRVERVVQQLLLGASGQRGEGIPGP